MRVPGIHLVALLALSVLPAPGCATRETVTTEVIESRSWVGRSRADLITAWGEPFGEEIDADGRLVLVYRGTFRDSQLVPTPKHEVPDPRVPGGSADISAGPASKRYYNTSAVARFWLTDDARVLRYWIHPHWVDKARMPPKPGE